MTSPPQGATLANGPVTYGTTAAFTRSLRRVVWTVKFRPNLPPRYDGNPEDTRVRKQIANCFGKESASENSRKFILFIF